MKLVPAFTAGNYKSMVSTDPEAVGAFCRALVANSETDLALVRQALLAWSGVEPENEDMRTFVRTQRRYVPVAGKSEADLTESESAILAAVDAVMAERSIPVDNR